MAQSSQPSTKPVTGAAAILHALEAAGITHLFVNLGSDHPAFLSAFAGRQFPKIRVFTSPNEMNALSAASGFAQLTGKPAAVLVHVECGTQGLAGAVHNLAAEINSLTRYIHWIQDVPDQRAIVRQYMRYEHEIRRPQNAVQLVLRALQFVMSEPQGPAYLIASREVLEEETDLTVPAIPSQDPSKTAALEPQGLGPASLDLLCTALLRARKPLIVTSYLGRSKAGFEALRGFATLLAIPVHESAPIYNNFPTTSYLHQGHQWNGGGQLPALAEADVVLVIDADVPWIPAQSKPSPDAKVYHLDCDPLKENTTLWSLPCEKRWKVDSATALEQLAAAVRQSALFGTEEIAAIVNERQTRLKERFTERRARLASVEEIPAAGNITVPYFMSRLREAASGVRVVGLNESTTNLGNVADHLHHDEPHSLIGSGGGALGWYSGGAVGASLALRSAGRQDDLVVAFTGDGTWLFGVPSCAYWMAKKYETPFLTVIWNNGGWGSPKNACIRIHPEVAGAPVPEGRKLSDELMVSITPSPAFGKIAEGAGDAWWAQVTRAEGVDEACREAIRVVREEKRSAVIEVVIDSI
ncbi:related to thiamine pyrophosphate-requiring enzymes [acetolactate synthase, pyruvate dehydrogenase (cytochrome), glyoxylate carboligase, phosphonopyruvate decarboxylase] [Cephalotrichum gorgonifer]|uniref:Related to thiamine pyrophosphate-requiring enzymes [acetolactate synthase, pyruvate dehydrogenase (Cytochrome), glyoxylate carboligase, phosphonopyruvate decarboxylase] n=1 Tax=Cephalotrichum gorgonifer TaxID=2041049 RepID=A0AAE8SVB5_9PEZI|nr:related to thiamine pyrophosphate-requiring enzymes [acetolactate synthase, pyruvate dehydrogenase (cytochrome), glyoxylate carboligase, phosphonopyruvate decarboxylase] [Cephalotrichum gorgonifer]